MASLSADALPATPATATSISTDPRIAQVLEFWLGAAQPTDASALTRQSMWFTKSDALDAEIRTHTDPFLASVRKLLAGGRQERAVRNAYGALAP